MRRSCRMPPDSPASYQFEEVSWEIQLCRPEGPRAASRPVGTSANSSDREYCLSLPTTTRYGAFPDSKEMLTSDPPSCIWACPLRPSRHVGPKSLEPAAARETRSRRAALDFYQVVATRRTHSRLFRPLARSAPLPPPVTSLQTICPLHPHSPSRQSPQSRQPGAASARNMYVAIHTFGCKPQASYSCTQKGLQVERMTSGERGNGASHTARAARRGSTSCRLCAPSGKSPAVFTGVTPARAHHEHSPPIFLLCAAHFPASHSGRFRHWALTLAWAMRWRFIHNADQ